MIFKGEEFRNLLLLVIQPTGAAFGSDWLKFSAPAYLCLGEKHSWKAILLSVGH